MLGSLRRRAVEDLFDSRSRPEDDSFAGVAQFLADVHTTYAGEPTPTPRADLRAVLGGGVGGARVASVSILPSTMRRPRRSRVAVLAATLAVGIGATGGLAAASALPDSMQRAVANLADHFGVHLPQPDIAPPEPESGTGTDTPATGAATEPAPDAPTPTVPTDSTPTKNGATPTSSPTSLAPTTPAEGTSPTSPPSPPSPSTSLLPSLPGLPSVGVDPPLPAPLCQDESLLADLPVCDARGS